MKVKLTLDEEIELKHRNVAELILRAYSAKANDCPDDFEGYLKESHKIMREIVGIRKVEDSDDGALEFAFEEVYSTDEAIDLDVSLLDRQKLIDTGRPQ